MTTVSQYFKAARWTEFPIMQYSIFSDDFVEDKIFVAKVHAAYDKSRFFIKESVNEKLNKITVSDETKFYFNLSKQSNSSFYAKVKSSNYLKILYDHGVGNFYNQNINIYASFNSNKSLQNMSFRLGLMRLSQTLKVDNRIKVAWQGSSRNMFYYNRTIWSKDKFLYGFIGVLDLTQRIIQKNNFLFGYFPNSMHSLLLRCEVDDFRKASLIPSQPSSYFDSFTFDYITKVNQNLRVGLQLSLTVRGNDKLKNLLLVVENLFPQSKTLFKVKIDHNAMLTLSVKKPLPKFQDIATVTASLGATDLFSPGSNRYFKHGVQIDLNL